MQESLAEWARDGIWIRGEASPAGAQDAQVDLGGKERDVETVGRDGVAGGAGDPIDEALDLQELAVDLDTGGAEVRQVNHGLARVKIAGVVNRGLGPQSPFLLEVLLDVRMLVLDVQTGIDPVGDHPRPVSVSRSGRGFGELGGEEQAHPVGSSQVEVFPD